MMGRGKRVGATASLFLGIALLAPIALAEPVTGVFSFAGTMTLLGESQMTAIPVAAFTDDAANLVSLEIMAQSIARVSVFEIRYQVIQAGPLPPVEIETSFSERSWTATGLRVALLPNGDHAGLLGFYPGENAVLIENATAQTVIEPMQASTMGDGTRTGQDKPHHDSYTQEITTPHLRITTLGEVGIEGTNGVKLIGPDVELSAENVTNWETGRKQISATEVIVTWLYIALDSGRIMLTTAGEPLEIAASRMQSFATSGEIRVASLSGEMRGRETTYAADGSQATLVGRFTGSLTPADVGDAALLRLEGDLRAASVGFYRQPIPVGPHISGLPPWLWSAVFIGAAVVASGATAGALLWQRRRAEREVWDAEYCKDAAEECMRIENHARALVWIRRARERRPRSARLAAHETKCLALMSDVPGALRAYADALSLADDGSPALAAALLMRQHSYPTEAVINQLRTAVEKTPTLLREIEREFPEIRDRPSWQYAAKTARIRSP